MPPTVIRAMRSVGLPFDTGAPCLLAAHAVADLDVVGHCVDDGQDVRAVADQVRAPDRRGDLPSSIR